MPNIAQFKQLPDDPRGNAALDAEFVALEDTLARKSPLYGAGNLWLFSERQYNATTGRTGQSNYRVSVMLCGDSLAERINGWIAIYLAKDFPNNQGRGLGNTTNPLSGPPNDNHPQTGTLADVSGDAVRLSGQHSLWPDGLVYRVRSTGVLTFPPRRITTLTIYEADPRKFTTIRVAFIKQSGAGSFDIETSTDGTTWTKQGATVSTNNATTIGAVEERTVTEGVYHVRVKHLSGAEFYVIGLYTGFANSVAGYDAFGMSQGGITPVQFTQTPLAIVTPVMTALDPALVTFHFADTNADVESTFNAVMAIARAGNPKRSVLWVASHSYKYDIDQAAADNDTQLTRDFLLSKTESDQIAVLDVRGMTGNYENIVAQDWDDDGVHMDQLLYQYCYSILEQNLPITHPGSKRFDPDTIDNLSKLFATQGKAFGTMALSDITEPGIHFIANGTGMPNNDQGVVLSFGIGPEATHPFALFGVQLATNPYSADTGWYRRTRNGGTWGSWVSLGSTPDLSGYALLDHVHDEVSIQDSVGAGQATISSADDTLSFLDQSGAPVSSTVGLTDLARASDLSSYATTAAVAAGYVALTGNQTVAGVKTFSSQVITSVNGATSTPATILTGTWFTGGTATTTKPQWLVEPTGATSTAWATTGTGVGVNAASGFAGNLMDLQLNGVSRASVSASGTLTVSNVFIYPSDIEIRGSGEFTWGTGGNYARIAAGSGDGILNFRNTARNGFNRITLGGTGTSHPSIKRNGTAVNIRLADDSADAPLTCALLTASGGVQANSVESRFGGVSGTMILHSGGGNGGIQVANGSGGGFDTFFARQSAGVWQCGTAANNANGSLRLTNLFASGSGNFGGSGVATPGTLGGAVVYARQTGGSTGQWRGRIVAGGDNVAFLLGEYNSQAWLGGHNAALNAWLPLRINPDGTSDLYLGNTGTGGTNPILTIANSTALSTFSGSIRLSTVATGISYKTGTGQRAGNATLVAGTVTVTNTSITANSVIILCVKTIGGTVGTLSYTLSAGASFTINSSNIADTSVISYLIQEVV